MAVDDPTLSKPLANRIPRAAKRADVSRATIYNQIKAGRLRAVKVGARTLILEDDLQLWLSSLRSVA